ncbi:glycosyl transferase [Dactylosporangium sp. NPDC049742]|uniref:glycosyl transferase n=1 Tax=Dactylosporangium sp. NPDC049742 TaxID=3154737 RepID=UPI00343E21D0
MDEGQSRSRWAGDAVAVAGYLAGAVVLCGRLLAHPGQRLPYTPGDRILAEYYLAWAARCVRHLENPFLLDRLNAPVGVNGMANTTMFGLGLPLAPVTMLVGPGITFDLLVVLTLTATAAAWFWLLSRHVVDNRVAAWVGGLVAAFAPSVANHATFHPNLTAQFLVPVIVWRVVKLRDAPVRGGLILAALVVWQVFINEETLFITALAIGVFGLLWLVQRPRETRALSVLAGLGVTLLATSVVLAFPLWWQFSGTGAYRGGEQQMTAFHTDLLGFTSFSRNSVAVRFSEFQPEPGFSAEQHGYFGWPLVIAVAAVVAWRWREPLVRSLAGTGVLFAVLSLGNELTLYQREIGVPGPYALLRHLPLFDTLLPTRLGEAATWAVAPLVAIGLDRLPAPAGLRLLKVGLVAAVLVPAAPVPIKVFDRPAVPAFIASGEWRSFVGPQESVLIVPLATFEHWTAMSWATATGTELRMSHGYFLGPAGGVLGRHATVGAPARPTDRLINAATGNHQVTAVTDLDREQARLDLAYWRTSIILAPDGPAAAAERGTLDALFGPGRLTGGLWLWDVRNP